MKKFNILGIAFSLIGVACAPVASSVPKLIQQIPSKGDRLNNDVGRRFTISDSTPVDIVSQDKYEAFEKKLDSDYQLIEYTGSDRKLSEFRDTRTISEIAISPKIIRADIRVIFVVNAESVTAKKAEAIKIDWLTGVHDEKGLLTMSVSEKSTSSPAWAVVKKKTHSIVIAYREATIQ